MLDGFVAYVTGCASGGKPDDSRCAIRAQRICPNAQRRSSGRDIIDDNNKIGCPFACRQLGADRTIAAAATGLSTVAMSLQQLSMRKPDGCGDGTGELAAMVIPAAPPAANRRGNRCNGVSSDRHQRRHVLSEPSGQPTLAAVLERRDDDKELRIENER